MSAAKKVPGRKAAAEPVNGKQAKRKQDALAEVRAAEDVCELVEHRRVKPRGVRRVRTRDSLPRLP